MALTDLIGRAVAMRHVRDLLSVYRIVTLTGPGGIGKTRLALEIARLLSPEFGGSVWWVGLGSLSDASLVPAAIANVLGLQIGGNDISPAALARIIGGGKLLLVIDNCEHVIDAAARIIETMVRHCPAVSVLATSREHMRIDGEAIYRVPPLDLPGQHPSEPGQVDVRESSAVQLFIARMSKWRSGGMSQDEPAAIGAICRRLDGIPLAIELAAARAATLGVAGVLSRLDDRFALLTGGRRNALPKHRTLRATLDWSYDLLSAVERVLLRRLAIFAAAFPLAAATAVTGNGDAPSPDIADGISNLAAKSLVVSDNAGPVARFRLLETTRVYAFEKLASSGELRQFARRHAEYYRSTLAGTRDDRAARPIHIADLGNAHAALEWCFGVNGDPDLGVGLAAAAAPVFLAMSLISECYRWSRRALLALPETVHGGHEEMRLQAALGMSSMYAQGQGDVALQALNRSLAIAEARDDAATQLPLLSMLQMFHDRIGDVKTALGYARRGSVIARTVEDPAALALAHCFLGFSLHRAGDLDGARAEIEAALRYGPISQETSRTHLGFDGHCIASVTLAKILWLRGHPAQAMQQVRQAVKDAAALDHAVTLSVVMIWAIVLFLWAGDLVSAEDHMTWFMARARASSSGIYLAVGRAFKGQLAVLRGDAIYGIERLRDSLADLHSVRYELLTTPFNISLVQGLAATDQFSDGMALIDETIRLVEANGDHYFMPELLRVRAGVLLSMPSPNVGEVELNLTRSLELSHRQGERAWELRAAVDLAALLASRGQAASAQNLLRPVFERFVEGRDMADLKAAERLLATVR